MLPDRATGAARTQNYGFRLLFDPPASLARCICTTLGRRPPSISTDRWPKAGGVPLWLPLPTCCASARLIEHVGAASSTYEVRVEYVCLAAAGCGARRLTSNGRDSTKRRFPSATCSRTHSCFRVAARSIPLELQRRALSTSFSVDGALITTWHHDVGPLPESFAVKVSFYRLSTGAFLSGGLTADPTRLHAYAVRAGLHS